jgi:hypothetical protein
MIAEVADAGSAEQPHAFLTESSQFGDNSWSELARETLA